MEILNKKVKDFLKEQNERQNTVSPNVIGYYGAKSANEIRGNYKLGRHIYIKSDYACYYKDENDNEYYFELPLGIRISDEEMFSKFNKMRKEGLININVKDIIIANDKKKIEILRKIEDAITTTAIPYFFEKEIKSTDLSEILLDFMSFLYGLSGCRGIVEFSRCCKYIDVFLASNKIHDLKEILYSFEKKIKNDGGIVQVNHYYSSK